MGYLCAKEGADYELVIERTEGYHHHNQLKS